MTANVSRNKRSFESAQLTLPGRAKRRDRISIDPQLILRQAELISLKRKLRCKYLTGYRLERTVNKTATNVVKIVNAEGVLSGYLKMLSDPYVHNNAIVEKIRWDLAVLAGDQDVHAPTALFNPILKGKLLASHIQVHEQGLLMEKVFDEKEALPRLALLRSLILTIVYGGFDDHLLNLIFQQDKIIHFDNGGSFSSGKQFIKWADNHYMYCFRPSILRFEAMNYPLNPDEIRFIQKELKKYVNIFPLFEAYFARPDVKKMIGRIEAGVIDEQKIVEGMKERVQTVQEKLETSDPISPREWIFMSFPLFRVTLALHMVHKSAYSIKALKDICMESLDTVIEEIDEEKRKNPNEVINIALDNADMKTVVRLLKELPKCSEEEREKGVNLAIRYLAEHSEIEKKNGKIDYEYNYNLFLIELTKHKIDTRYVNKELSWNDCRLFVLPNYTIVIQNSIFNYPPLTVAEFIEHAKGNKKENIQKFEAFIAQLMQSHLPHGSGTLLEIGRHKAQMLPNTFRVFQIRDNHNDRFILTEKDAKGNVYSQDIGYDMKPVWKAKTRIDQLKPVTPEHQIGEFYTENESYKVRPGECVGTYVVQVGKLEVAPMYAHELQKWVYGERKELELVKFLNQLNVGSPQEAALKEGEHLFVQEKETSPMKFTIYQRPSGFPNVYRYSLVGEYRKGLRIITEMGRAFFLDRETFITRLKNGAKLDGDIHAGNRS